MDDYISRQTAINALMNDIEPFVIVEPGTTCVIGAGIKDSDVIKMLEAMPSADVQPVRHGHWVYGEDDYGIDGYHCNKCGFFVPWDYTHKFINFIEDYHYCPHCNARMDGEHG